MFGRRSPAAKVASVDAAFARAEQEIRDLGQTVAARITTEFRAGRISKQGVQQRVRLAIEQLRALPAETVPSVMCERLETTFKRTIVDGLKAAGITIPELTT